MNEYIVNKSVYNYMAVLASNLIIISFTDIERYVIIYIFLGYQKAVYAKLLEMYPKNADARG